MEAFSSFLTNLTSIQKLGWIFFCLSISWILEFGSPLVQLNYSKWKHARVNLAFLFFSILINVLFSLLTVGIFIWLDQNQWGVFNLIELNPWLELLLAVMALDFFAQYIAHYLLHRVRWMWKFHLVHHSDTDVDATTGTRHHPGDYLIRECFALATIFIFGIPVAYYLFYRFSTIFFTYFSHANIKLPQAVDHMLSYCFVTPNMHKFHHHYERPWTDSNFGNIFSIWDRILGSFVYDDPKLVQYGVDVVDSEMSENLSYQLKLPINPNIKTD